MGPEKAFALAEDAVLLHSSASPRQFQAVRQSVHSLISDGLLLGR